MNTFGKNLRLTTFGESHGPAVGGVIDGFPAGFKIDFDKLLNDLSERAPGSSRLVTQRQEMDIPEFLSGINESGLTLGTPIGYIIRNKDHRSNDYSEVATKYRPNHADYTYEAKYGLRDYRGGGRASARETANWVVAGSLAAQYLEKSGVKIFAVLSGAGEISYASEFLSKMSKEPSFPPELCITDKEKTLLETEVIKAKNLGDSIGGVVSCIVSGIRAGLGNPVFEKFHSRLASAMMAINGAKGFEYGFGMYSSGSYGSQILDIFKYDNGTVVTKTNFSGGVQGGITNGMPIFFNVFFKPTPTIMKEVPTITNENMETTLKMRGRHDPCIAVRAVAVVKAMAALVTADFLL